MKDGSDAVADWPLLNALLNTAAGASWVSIHNGGGVGIGYSLHAGQVTVADGTEMMAKRIERVLTTDPGMGIIRHADAGYEEAKEFAQEESRESADGKVGPAQARKTVTDHVGTGLRPVQAEQGSASLLPVDSQRRARLKRCRAPLGPDGSRPVPTHGHC